MIEIADDHPQKLGNQTHKTGNYIIRFLALNLNILNEEYEKSKKKCLK